MIDKLTDTEKKKLQEAFRALVALVNAESFDNHSTCGSYHIKPFNTHWDERTVNEVKYHVNLYLSTWVIHPLREVFGLDDIGINKQMMLDYHKSQVVALEFQLKQEKNKLG